MGFEEGDVAIHMSEKSQAEVAKMKMECHGVLHGDRRLTQAIVLGILKLYAAEVIV